MPSEEIAAYEMSAQQLDELWNYESFLAHFLLDLPHQKCVAVPSKSWGNGMPAAEFSQLKEDIRKMWCRAAQSFVAFRCEENAGWGLKLRCDLGKKLSVSSDSLSGLGWVVKVPSQNECPTAHRYIRSPPEDGLYVGGPIRLTKYSDHPSLRPQRFVQKSPLKYYTFVSTFKAVDRSSKNSLNYNLMKCKLLQAESANALCTPNGLLRECCSAGDQGANAATTNSVTRVNSVTKKMQIVTSYLWCTYCGVNLESGAAGSRVNRKEHWATHHAVQVCHDMGAAVEEIDPARGVVPKDFKKQLDLVDSVLQSLRNYNYSVIPASQYFRNVGITPSEPVSTTQEDLHLSNFFEEAQKAFQRYKVIYLKGIRIPKVFSDLLPAPLTSYKDVVWVGHQRPRSNSFSVRKDLSPEELEQHELDIVTEFQSIVISYMKAS